MSTILFKKADDGSVDKCMVDASRVHSMLECGWSVNENGEVPNENGEEVHHEKADGEEEADDEETESEEADHEEEAVLTPIDEEVVMAMSGPELRKEAKKRGLENWEDAQFKTLRRKLIDGTT